MRALRIRLLAPLCALFGLHQVAQRLGLGPAWADAWLDDLLCLPLALALVLVVHRALRVRDDRYVLPAGHVLAAWGLITIVFEGVLPVLDAAYTADPVDAAAYGAGALLFQVSLNRPAGGRRGEPS